MLKTTATIVCLTLVFAPPLSAVDTAPVAAVASVLDTLHRAASEADGETYFELFVDDAVYIGTDASERWTLDEFKAFAAPYFDAGRGWTYTVTERHVDISPSDAVAWFDEILWNDRYGTCRGSGVLLATDEGWRVAQYHLTFPIPNDLAKELTARIKEHGSANRDPKP